MRNIIVKKMKAHNVNRDQINENDIFDEINSTTWKKFDKDGNEIAEKSQHSDQPKPYVSVLKQKALMAE